VLTYATSATAVTRGLHNYGVHSMVENQTAEKMLTQRKREFVEFLINTVADTRNWELFVA
jgi:predicted double-glycine peptidase